MKHKLNNYTILNGKYAIEQYIDYQDNCYKYKATDLVMREEVYIYEFCPEYIAGRIENTDRLNIKESVFVQFSEELKAFESNLSSVALGKRNAEIAKNYFRENNTGYLVVVENRKTLIRRKLITRVVLCGLVAIVAIEAGILVFSRGKKDDKSTNDIVITDESIEQLVEEETVNADVMDENADEETIAKEECKKYSEEELLIAIRSQSGGELWNITHEGFCSAVYDDFDGDGHNELFALIEGNNPIDYNIELWFSDGEKTELIQQKIGNQEKYAELRPLGLEAIQFGKIKILQIVYVDYGVGEGPLEGVLTYSLNEAGVVSNEDEILPYIMANDVYGSASMIMINKKGSVYYLNNGLDGDVFKKITKQGTFINGYYGFDGEIQKLYSAYDVYYINGEYKRFEGKTISLSDAEKYSNFSDAKVLAEDVIMKMVLGFELSVYDYIPYDIELDSIYVSDNDKLYMNYIEHTLPNTAGSGDEYEFMAYDKNYTEDEEICVIFQINEGALSLLNVQPVFHKL